MKVFHEEEKKFKKITAVIETEDEAKALLKVIRYYCDKENIAWVEELKSLHGFLVGVVS